MSHEIEKDWITKAGLRAVCLVVKFGERRHHRCGYVEVPRDHALYGVEYNQQSELFTQKQADSQTIGRKSLILAFTAMGDDGKVRRAPEIMFDCHGGLTFSGFGHEEYPVKSEGFWYGFDCAHCGDGEIEEDPEFTAYFGSRGGIVQTLGYVERECEQLADQIVTMFPLKGATPDAATESN